MKALKVTIVLASLGLIAAACGGDGETSVAEPVTHQAPADTTETGTAPDAGNALRDAPAGGFPIANQLEATFLDAFDSTEVDVLDSTMHYVSLGEPADHATVLLHGQPTSSFLWRDVLPSLEEDGYIVAPDLIGMGRSGRPEIDYTLGEQVAYFGELIDALGVDSVVLVMHDVGGLTGLSWAAQNPDRVTGVVMLETAFAPAAALDQLAVPEFIELLSIVRDPTVEDELVYRIFVEELIQSATMTVLPEDVLDVYRAPWADTSMRGALVAWPQQLPIAGVPAESHELMSAAFAWVSAAEIPKILMFGEPGFLMQTPVVELAVSAISGLETASVGSGTHYLQEDVPQALGAEISSWLRANGL